MIDKHFTIPLKGNRNYITGADILFEVSREVGPAVSVSAQFYMMWTDTIKIRIVTKAEIEELRGEGKILAILTFGKHDGSKLTIVVEGVVSGLIPQRVEYDEAFLISSCSNGHNCTSLTLESDERLYDVLVALNKHMLNTIFPGGKWVFYKLDLHHLPTQVFDVQLIFQELMRGGAYVSSVQLNGQVAGKIYFTK